MSEHTPFLEIFPGCADLAAFSGGLDKAYIGHGALLKQTENMEEKE